MTMNVSVSMGKLIKYEDDRWMMMTSFTMSWDAKMDAVDDFLRILLIIVVWVGLHPSSLEVALDP
jgi:hypothetical protein